MSTHGLSKNKRLLVVSLDGFPWTLLRDMLKENKFSKINELMTPGQPAQMTSVYPTVSSVAWSSYMSGRNPGHHGIFGFIDKQGRPPQLYLPNAVHRIGNTIWRVLGENNLPSIVMNIPVTYPPSDINGVIISGFLGVELDKSVRPTHLANELIQSGYQIDADTGNAQSDPLAFIQQLKSVIRTRCKTFCALLKNHPWNFAHLHIMETDRLFHFLWRHVENADSSYHSAIVNLMSLIDMEVARLIRSLDDSEPVIVMSDHGFTAARMEFDLNAWLADNGWLNWSEKGQTGLDAIADGSLAYSLLPGRIYVRDVALKQQLSKQLRAINQPNSNYHVSKSVLDGKKQFSGDCMDRAPDLIAVANDGIELRGRLKPGPLFQPSRLQGMHTSDDALLWIRHRHLIESDPDILDLYPTILSCFSLKDEAAEGRNIVNW